MSTYKANDLKMSNEKMSILLDSFIRQRRDTKGYLFNVFVWL